MRALAASLLVLSALAVRVPAAPRWEAQSSGVTARLRGVSAVSDRVAWASGAGGTVLRTQDGGASWTRLTIPAAAALDFRDVDAIDGATAYVLSIGAGSASRIYKTTNVGASWQLQFTNEDPKGFFDAMAFWDGQRGLVMGDSIDGRFDILRTMDGGRTWARVPAANVPDALPNEGAFAASGTNIAVMPGGHAWIGTGASARCRVLRTRDYGETWTLAETPVAGGPSAGIFSVAFRDPRHGIVTGGDFRKEHAAVDNAAISSDGGVSWRPLKGLGGFRSVVAWVPGTTGSWIAVGPQGADTTTDDGGTWTPLEGAGYHALAFARSGRAAWGVGENGQIGKLTW